jgi:O-antigen/teichoic acid export membrane protein
MDPGRGNQRATSLVASPDKVADVQFNFLTGLARLRSDAALRGMSGVFVLKAVTTVLNLALITLAARSLGEHGFGIYSVLFSAAGLFGVVATFGQQLFLMRAWNEYCSAGEQRLLKGALIFTSTTCALGSIAVGVAFYAYYAASHEPMLAGSVALYLVSLSIVLTTSHLVRTAIGVGIGDGLADLLLVIPAIIYLSLCMVLNAPVEISMIFLLMAGGEAVAVAVHVVLMWRKAHARFPGLGRVRPEFDFRNWFARSSRLWISNGLEAANQYADVVLIGFLMSPTIAGGYFVTTRIANAFAMATDVIYRFSTRHFPDLYYRREFRKLDALLDTVAGVTLAIIVGGLVVIVCCGHWILGAFSADYVSYYGALVLLSLGPAAVAAAGPSGSILMLTGHEGRNLAIIGGTVLMRAVGFFVLIPLFGIIGAVAATTISFIWMAIMLQTSARSAAGIDGSVLRLLTRFRKSRASVPAE